MAPGTNIFSVTCLVSPRSRFPCKIEYLLSAFTQRSSDRRSGLFYPYPLVTLSMSHISRWTQGYGISNTIRRRKIRNSKHEIRNKFEYRRFQIQKESLKETPFLLFWYLYFDFSLAFLPSQGETWNEFGCRMFKIQGMRKSKHPFWSFEFWYCFEFRISNFLAL